MPSERPSRVPELRRTEENGRPFRSDGDFTCTPSWKAATTHDPLWNAAQRQLRAEGRIAGYLRMLWDKKMIEWSRSRESRSRR